MIRPMGCTDCTGFTDIAPAPGIEREQSNIRNDNDSFFDDVPAATSTGGIRIGGFDMRAEGSDV